MTRAPLPSVDPCAGRAPRGAFSARPATVGLSRLSRLLRLAVFVGLATVGAAAAGRTARGDGDLEPLPPMLLFPEPDDVAREEIERIINTSFADVSKAVEAREILVRRFGLVAVPVLVARLEAASNEPEMWNAALTLGTMRRTYGPSHLLWPAIRPLTKVLKTSSGDPWRRIFAALALGEFHGPDSVRRSADSREGTQEGARQAAEALIEARKALAGALADGRAEVGAAAALALGKTGGTAAAALVLEHVRSLGGLAPLETRLATLLALGLLPGQEHDEGGLARSLQDIDRRVRAKAALATACWAIGERAAAGPAAAGSPSATRAASVLPLLVPSTNTQLRIAEEDGAEATYARGALALLDGRLATWDELFLIAASSVTERETAVAAAQNLLFAPAQAQARRDMAELVGRKNVGNNLKEPVIAAFLLVAGTDGTTEGVRSCREFLRNKGKVPLGRPEYDVRYFAAIGLLRGYVLGTIRVEARPDAAEALSDAWRDTFPMVPPGPRSPRTVLEGIVKPARAALAGPDATLPRAAPALLETTFVDPDALVAHDPIDTALDRLNDAVRALYNLDGLAPAAAGPPGSRTPNKEDQPQRFLKGWLGERPYFTRLDFQRDRGRVPARPVPPGRDPRLELPRTAR